MLRIDVKVKVRMSVRVRVMSLAVMVRIRVKECMKVLTYIDVQTCVEKDILFSSFLAILHSRALIDSTGMKCLFHVTTSVCWCVQACEKVLSHDC